MKTPGLRTLIQGRRQSPGVPRTHWRSESVCGPASPSGHLQGCDGATGRPTEPKQKPHSQKGRHWQVPPVGRGRIWHRETAPDTGPRPVVIGRDGPDTTRRLAELPEALAPVRSTQPLCGPGHAAHCVSRSRGRLHHVTEARPRPAPGPRPTARPTARPPRT